MRRNMCFTLAGGNTDSPFEKSKSSKISFRVCWLKFSDFPYLVERSKRKQGADVQVSLRDFGRDFVSNHNNLTY